MTVVGLGPVAQWLAFIIFTLLAVAGGLGMVATMSMFRRGIFLMISFIGVAGLFILLLADLLALLQIMMYVGGMLVMILFMVLFARDPGGARMVSMKMSFIEKFFSLGIKPEQEGNERDTTGMHAESGERPAKVEYQMHVDGSDADVGYTGRTHEGMMGGMIAGMAMTTPIKRPAAILAILAGALLISLLWLHPVWKETSAIPDPRSAERIGLLLMSKYMIAFEGASLLILTGIFGAVLLARSGRPAASLTRMDRVAVEETPPSIEAAPLEPIIEPGDVEPVAITEIQQDDKD